MAFGACKKDPPTDDASADTANIGGTQGTPGLPQRLSPVALEPLGLQPGYLADAPIYAAMRAGPTQQFFHDLPLPDEIIRELARARRDIGFDPLNEDVLKRFAIPEDAVISMSFGRALGRDRIDSIRTGLRKDDRVLREVKAAINREERRAYPAPAAEEIREEVRAVELPPEPELPSEPVPAPIAYDLTEPAAAKEIAKPPTATAEPIDPSPPEELLEEVPGGVPGGVVGGVLGGVPYHPEPAPLSAAERAEAESLRRNAAAAALQFHFHVPTDEPGTMISELRAKLPPSTLAKGDKFCAGFEVALCSADYRNVFVVRRTNDAVRLDLITFTAISEASPADRRPAIEEALQAPTTSAAPLEAMAGHASAYIDAKAWANVAEFEGVSSTVRRLSWYDDDDLRRSLGERLDRVGRIHEFLKTELLFEGMLLRAHHDGERSQLLTSWRLRDGQAKLAARVLAPPPVHVPIPSIEALCDDALMCARSRGVPSPSALGTELATGLYGSADSLDDAFDDVGEESALIIAASTWPNALGTAGWHLPLSEARGPEAAFVRGIVDAVGRIQAFGLSVKRLDVGRRSLTAEYGAFLRVPVGDMSLVRTLLSMAGERATPVDVEGLQGVTMVAVPDDDVPATLLFHEDADPVKVDDEDARHGWLAVADKPERLAWLEGMDTDKGTEPWAYFEIPNLWTLVASIPDAMGELAFARTWAMQRSFKAALVIDGGVPTVIMEVATAEKDAKSSDDK